MNIAEAISTFDPTKPFPNSIGKVVNKIKSFSYNIIEDRKKKLVLINEQGNISSHSQIGILINKWNLGEHDIPAIKKNFTSNCDVVSDNETVYFSLGFLPYTQKKTQDSIKKFVNEAYNNIKLFNLQKKLLSIPVISEVDEKEEIVRIIEKENQKELQSTELKDETTPLSVICTSGVPEKMLKSVVDTIMNNVPESIDIPKRRFFRGFSKAINKKIDVDSPYSNIKILFNSYPWSSEHSIKLSVANEIFGSAVPFSAGGAGKGIFSRAYTEVLQKKPYIFSAKSINCPFKKTGVFGLDFSCDGNKTKETLDDMISSLNRLREDVSSEECERAKNILKRKILSNLCNTTTRVEDTTKSYFYYNKILKSSDYLKMINSVKSRNVIEAMQKIGTTEKTLMILKAPPKINIAYRTLNQ